MIEQPRTIELERCDSTQDELRLLARAGAPAFTVVRADVQDAIEGLTDVGEVSVAASAGLGSSDIEISVLGNNVRISGEVKDRELLQPDGARWLIRERHYGPFDRSVTLPASLNSEQASAEFEDGVLRVHIPKADGARPKTIPVKTSNAE